MAGLIVAALAEPTNAQQRPKLTGKNRDVTVLFQLARVFRFLEAEPAESNLAVENTVTIEVDHVIGLSFVAGSIEFHAQGR